MATGMDDEKVVSLSEHRRQTSRLAHARRTAWQNRVGTAIFILSLLAVGVSLFLISPFAQVSHFTIHGALTPQERKMVEQSLTPTIGVPLASLDLNTLGLTVKRHLWVDQVEVSRDWPNGVTVLVHKRECAAVMTAPDRHQCLDKNGYLLDIPNELIPPALPSIQTTQTIGSQALTAPPGVVHAYHASQLLPDNIKSYVYLYEVREGVGLVLHLRDLGRTSLTQAQIVVGDLQEFAEKAFAIGVMLDRMEREGRQSAVIDVRVPERPVVSG